MDTSKNNPNDRCAQMEALLSQVDTAGELPKSIARTPGVFFREAYDVWLFNGGKISGRYNRNSINRIENEWLIGRTRVKSFHAKISGKVRINKRDATLMLQLFLNRWRYIPQTDSIADKINGGYVPYGSNDITALIDNIIKSIFTSNNEASNLGFLIPQDVLSNIPLDEKESRNQFAKQCLASSAVITFSRHQILLGSNISWKIKTFWEIIDEMYRRSQDGDDSDFLLIWIVDIGSRIIEDSKSFDCFYNAGLLAMHFVALAGFRSDPTAIDRISLYRSMRTLDKSTRKDFWRWFRKKAFVIVQNFHEDEYLDYYNDDEKQLRSAAFAEIGTTSEQILPTTVPQNWLKKIRELYGRESRDLNRGTFTALVSDNENTSQLTVKYHAHSQIDTQTQEIRDDIIFRQTELASPGPLYDDAMAMAYLAARYVLHRDTNSGTAEEHEEAAFAFLASRGYQTLNVRDFVQIYWSSIDLVDS